MKIRHDTVSNVLETFNIQESDKVSLFVYSTKKSNLSRLNLDDLSLEERSAKLKKLAKDNRFVAVIERGDALFAFMNKQYAETHATEKPLSIDGKKVTVQQLSEAESARLSEVGEEFEKFLEIIPHEKLEDQNNGQSEERRAGIDVQRYNEQSDKSQFTAIHRVIMKLANIPEEIKSALLAKWNEDNYREARSSEKEARKKALREEQVQEDLRNKEIVGEQVKKDLLQEEEIKEKEI